MDVLAEATEERMELVEFLSTLTDEQWEAQSLCSQWRVRDVVAHLVSYDDLGLTALARRAPRAGFLPDRLNALTLREYAERDPHDLVRLLRRHARPTGLTAAFGGAVGLTDSLIHHQDIRRPLQATREIPDDRVALAIRFAYVAPVVRGFWNVRGVRLSAPRVDWTAGRGEPAQGAPEAVLMAVAGRPGVARELTGPGSALLEQRLG